MRASGQSCFDFEGNGAAGDGVGGVFMVGLGYVAWFLGWGRGGFLTKFIAGRVCLKKR